MQSLSTWLQDKLDKIYFYFEKIEEISHIYEETCEQANEWFQSVYVDHVSLTNKSGTEEK